MKAEYVPVTIRGLSVNPGDDMPFVILRDQEEASDLCVPVGPFEASAILLELEGIAPPRPLTHDLLADLFREGGLSLECAELFEADSDNPRARIVYRRGLRRRAKEVRPSDALALALRLKAPITASRALLEPRLAQGFSPYRSAFAGE